MRQRLTVRYGQTDDVTADALQHILVEKFAVRVDGPLETVLDRYRSEEAKVLKFIEQTDLFPIPKDQRIQILRTPPFGADHSCRRHAGAIGTRNRCEKESSLLDVV